MQNPLQIFDRLQTFVNGTFHKHPMNFIENVSQKNKMGNGYIYRIDKNKLTQNNVSVRIQKRLVQNET